MKKRIYQKIVQEFENGLEDAVYNYLTRPEGKEFLDISIGIIQMNLMMLLTYQVDKGKITIGKESRIDNVKLTELKYKKTKFIEFEGCITSTTTPNPAEQDDKTISGSVAHDTIWPEEASARSARKAC